MPEPATPAAPAVIPAAAPAAANVGLGQMVLNASNFLRTDIVIMGIIVIGVVAYAFDLFMRWVERQLVPWKGRMWAFSPCRSAATIDSCNCPYCAGVRIGAVPASFAPICWRD